MKTRTGFVSNSSSSSFIIAVPNKATECKCCGRSNQWLLQAFGKYLGALTERGNKLQSMTGIEAVDNFYKKELDDLVKSKDYSQKQLDFIEELQKDTKLFENYERLKNQLDRSRISSIREESKCYADEKPTESAKRVLAERKALIQQHLADYDKKESEIKDIIKKLKAFIKKGYTVYSFTVDNWATDAESALKGMMVEGVVETIWSQHN